MAVLNSSTEVIALMFLWSAFLSRSHIFSIIFIFGDCAGQESDFILFLSLYLTIHRALWTGALSSWKMKSSDGKYLETVGHRCFYNISDTPERWEFILQMPKCPLRCMKYIPRPLLQKLLPRRCVHAFRLPFFSGFSPNVDAFIYRLPIVHCLLFGYMVLVVVFRICWATKEELSFLAQGVHWVRPPSWWYCC